MKKGILLHVSSLPSSYGIGKFDNHAKEFMRGLSKAGYQYWQVLPLGVTTFGDSPYQSLSAFAINPYFIDPSRLVRDNLVSRSTLKRLFSNPTDRVDYGFQYATVAKLLHIAYKRFDKGASEYKRFVRYTPWLRDYAVFCHIKKSLNGASWDVWPRKYMNYSKNLVTNYYRTNRDECEYYCMEQYLACTQWMEIKEYANSLGIQIIGDMPIYSNFDSVEVWSNRKQYLVDDNRPVGVAGVPPDAFSEDGQLWGNPLYDWTEMAKDGYAYWRMRLQNAKALFDLVRIDHFRALEAYYYIPYGKMPVDGHWEKGPDKALIDALKPIGARIIAEDLGIITEEVEELLRYTGAPGMKVLQFAFDGDVTNPNIRPNPHSIVYTGTHDNPTTLDWYDSLSDSTKNKFINYTIPLEGEDVITTFERLAPGIGDTFIMPMQDVLRLRNARMNTPATNGGNWTWRMTAKDYEDWKRYVEEQAN